jgi:uncharacterized repeat protein (TIGR01451 family)
VQNGASTGPITVIAPAGTATTTSNFVVIYTSDVTASVYDSPDPVLVGSNLTYSVTLYNSGPFAAPGVSFTNTLPDTVILQSATTTSGTLNTSGNPITGSFGQVGVGSIITVTLIVKPQALGYITNVATVASLNSDPQSFNNLSTASTLVQPLPLLSIKRVATDRVRVSWPADLTNYSLTFKPLLDPTNSWSNVLTPAAYIGNELTVTETNNQPMRIYRLQRLP